MSRAKVPDHDSIPNVWPAAMNRAQLRAYLGNISETSLDRIVSLKGFPKVELLDQIPRFRKVDVDRWLGRLG